MVAQAIVPRALSGQFEVPGFDFRPDGAWRKRTNAIRVNRRQLLQAGAISALNARGPAATTRVSGAYRVPVIPIAFANVRPPFPAIQYQAALFDPAPTSRPYSVSTFYRQLSNGNITLKGTVLRWVTADSSDRYYEDGCNGIGITPCGHPGPGGVSTRFPQLLLEGLRATDDGTVDWGAFDNDGPDGAPNSGDDDGVVDVVLFLQPEVDGACGTSNLWAHRYYLGVLSGSQYATKTPRTGGGFIAVDDYTLQSAVGGLDACAAGQIMPIGIVAHETGHAFGLPDLYDVSSGTAGIGEWGLMGTGSYSRPYSPSRFEAWSLAELGWVTVDSLGPSRTVRLGPVASSDTVLYIPIPSTDEFYLLENRQSEESDTAQMNPACQNRSRLCAKAPGLLVWHLDQGQIDSRGGTNTVNVGLVHGVALIQADGLKQLDAPNTQNRGDAGDPYAGPSANRGLSFTTNPAAVDHQGAFVGFSIDSIYQEMPNGTMVFRFLRHPPSLFAAQPTSAAIRVNGQLTIRFEDIVPPGTRVVLKADSLQTRDPIRGPRWRFTGWSNGQPLRHTVIAGLAPDTVVASFVAEYQLSATAFGSGTLSASMPGTFFSPNTVITLTAQPAPGFVFSGWSGDTSSGAASITLTMSRHYRLTATFAVPVAVSAVSAVDAILGNGRLSAAQLNYLDQVGNKNAGYDLGDLLAFLTFTGVTQAPDALMTARQPMGGNNPPLGAGGRND